MAHPPPTVEAIIAAAAAKTGDIPCPFCNTKDWVLESLASGAQISGLWSRPAGGSFSLDHPVPEFAAISCGRCGFTRLHRLSLLLKDASS